VSRHAAVSRVTAVSAVPVKLSCVILTMGDRPAELARAVASALKQRDCDIEVVVVGNGTPVPAMPPAVKVIELPRNLGVAGGRNAGARACTGDVIMFLDDDGWYPDPAAGRYTAQRFGGDPDLGVISFRVTDPAGGPGARWHVPRLRAGDPSRSSEVTTFAGGSCAIRRCAFLTAGGLPGAFFYAHEETDLAWRLLELGYRLEYDANVRTCHHVQPNARHAGFYRLDGRNRVLLARRNLPWPLAAAYLLNWFGLTLLRERSPAAVRAWLAGFCDGWRMPAGGRRPISARTAWRMTRAGRPPII
jgi:GT2 family glycosyltransferase